MPVALCVPRPRALPSRRGVAFFLTPPPAPLAHARADHTALAAASAPPAKPLPAILVCTADHDDRVVPLHSFKVVAALQAAWGAAEAQTRPLLLRVESKAGHGAGKPTSKILDEYAEVYAFIAKETGAVWAP